MITNICTDVEINVVGLKQNEAKMNGYMNYNRALQTVIDVVSLLKRHRRDNIRVLNLSGAGAGHQDLCMKKIFEHNNISISNWDVVDTQKNDWLNNDWLIKQLTQNNIRIIYNDWMQGTPKLSISYDVIFCCEIVEHLDYTNAINLSKFISDISNNETIVVVSAPNPYWIIHRIKYLFSQDNQIDCDVEEHFRTKYYGHINTYSKMRLIALFTAFGMKVVNYRSINHWRYTFRSNPLKYLIGKSLELLIKIIKDSGFTNVVTFQVVK